MQRSYLVLFIIAHSNPSKQCWKDLDSATTEQLRERRTSLEFIYLRPAKQDVTVYNPYDLEIVGHSEVDEKDFYTMSTAGVTRFSSGTAGE
jgi:hypothetical protein